ncbi:hypothetical protein [Haloarcula sp. JP-L23]|uniref:hypothetical protein n=1 Tax=Haloarcula sp. JP-L23 TaxID=2716717 RepID=UPI00140EFA4B|nr:hypothetical protein G9465_18195 [Haloarcula sp. JP-L23]
MVRSEPGATAFILTGIAGLLGTILGYGTKNTPPTPRQPDSVTAILLVVCLGFVVTGWLWRREPDSKEARYRGVPALTLVLVGFMGIIGSLLVLQPWASRGLARLVLLVVTGGFSILAGGLLLAGVVWFRRREERYPLAVLTAILSVGLFHCYAQRFDPSIAVPVVALIGGVLATLSAIVVLYGLAPRVPV